ncbi:dynein intermediate chain 4, axonemal [Nilaparvata lugens]|uniref:dynein intermediate chain 4, axonemal n=1 Tax=Nilaparvata lugens TaxID=108931 RepID=UPI00193CE645|nr:dynein intermediate chain 4, axonemal [Nilaparvata lugens]
MSSKARTQNKINKTLNELLGKIEKPSTLDKVAFFEAEDENDQPRTASTQLEKVTFSVTRHPKIKESNLYSNGAGRQIVVTANKKQPFMVSEDERDRTPKRLLKSDNLYYCPVMDISEFGQKRFPVSDQPKAGIFDKDLIDTVNRLKRASVESECMSFSQLDYNLSAASSSRESIPSIDRAPSLYHVHLSDEELDRRMIPDDERLVLRLEETPTIQLFSIRSTAADVDTMEGARINDANEKYLSDNTRIKKNNDSFSQTTLGSNKVCTVSTSHPRPLTANKATFSSVWDYMDMVKTIRNRVIKRTKVTKMKVTGKVDKVEYETPEIIVEPIRLQNFVLTDPRRFYLKAMMIEHLLTGNNAQSRQEMFKTFRAEDEDSVYSFKHLWTYRTAETRSKSVASLSWNLYDPNMLAVGYTGGDKFSNTHDSLVCVWNVKNLVHPEREYTFELRLRSVRFSIKHPNILAVAFETGVIKLVDICTRELLVVGRNMSKDCSLQYGLCTVVWVEEDLMEDRLIECLGNGHVNKYMDLHLKTKKCVHHSTRVKERSKCNSDKEAVSAVCVKFHPVHRNLYMMGSSSGTVYKCDLQNTQSYLEKFDAHMGPIYSIEYNPVSPVIFLTSGADWCIRIWAEKLAKPLMVLTSGMSRITYADWHPHVPTVITNLNQQLIEVWDISKKLIKPQLQIVCPKKCLFTQFSFSMFGNSVCAGDTGGDCHVYMLDIAISIESPFQYLAVALLEALSADSDLKEEAIKVIPLLKTHKKNHGKTVGV